MRLDILLSSICIIILFMLALTQPNHTQSITVIVLSPIATDSEFHNGSPAFLKLHTRPRQTYLDKSETDCIAC